MTSANATSVEDVRGLEFDWLGSDEVGHVALFSTAGAGYTPAEVLRRPMAHITAIDALLALPASTAAKFAPDLAPDCINTWQLVAERGLYAFDCNPNGGPYLLVAAPVVPTRIEALPAIVVDLIATVRLALRFENRSVISDRLLGQAP